MRAVTIERFPGLDLRADPGDAPGALVATNVVLDGGMVRSRDGFAALQSGVASDRVKFLHAHSNSGLVTADGHLIVAATNGASGPVYARDVFGTTLASTTLPGVVSSGYATAATIGTASATYTYIVDTFGTGPVRRWDGTSWTSPGGMPASISIFTKSPADNRLVACDLLTSKVSFSDPGLPETWGANNFVRVTPGDGEVIQGAAVYNNLLIVFKSTKFFVFYGNSTDAIGSPIFNYRTVATGIGIEGASNYAANSTAVGPDGVYFQSTDGIYLTNGGAPVKISAALDPFYDSLRRVSPYWPFGRWVLGLSQMVVFKGRLHVTQGWFDGVTQGDITFVYDIASRTWSAWNFPPYPTPLSWGLESWNGLLVFGVGQAVLYQAPGVVADTISGVGTNFTSTYRMPFETYGSPGEKRLRDTVIEGIGTPTVRWSKDWGSLVTGSAVTLGTSPAIATGRQRLAIRGREFSLQLGATSGSWTVNRVQANVSDTIRPVSVAR